MRQKNVSLCPIHSAAKYEELIYITSRESKGKVEKCDSYKRNMRGEMIYVTTGALDVK